MIFRNWSRTLVLMYYTHTYTLSFWIMVPFIYLFIFNGKGIGTLGTLKNVNQNVFAHFLLLVAPFALLTFDKRIFVYLILLFLVTRYISILPIFSLPYGLDLDFPTVRLSGFSGYILQISFFESTWTKSQMAWCKPIVFQWIHEMYWQIRNLTYWHQFGYTVLIPTKILQKRVLHILYWSDYKYVC